MKNKLILAGLSAVLLLSFCTGDKKNEYSAWIRPAEAGNSLNLGEKLVLEIKAAGGKETDSVVYFIDGRRVGTSSAGNTSLSVPTGELLLGNRMVTARIYTGGEPEEISTNVVLRSSLVPEKIGYRVVETFGHDTASYTEGLEYHNGEFYESDGGNTPETGYSSLRRSALSGKVLQKTDIDPAIFAEGITITGDKILMLTYKDNVAMEYDLNNLKLLRKFPTQNPREGWGLCNDGKRIYNTNGSNSIFILDRKTYQQTGIIEVYDQNGPVEQLNELEYIDGKLFANIYTSDRIVIINPANGQVTAEMDMSSLYPARQKYNPSAEVLNGIAWDAKGRRLFVTGKKWDKLFRIEMDK